MTRPKAEPGTVFGRLLREQRVKKSITLEMLAESTGMNWTALRRLESSPSANPTLSTIHKLADALGCKPCDLIG